MTTTTSSPVYIDRRVRKRLARRLRNTATGQDVASNPAAIRPATLIDSCVLLDHHRRRELGRLVRRADRGRH
jgi:hypothetical protein